MPDEDKNFGGSFGFSVELMTSRGETLHNDLKLRRNIELKLKGKWMLSFSRI